MAAAAELAALDALAGSSSDGGEHQDSDEPRAGHVGGAAAPGTPAASNLKVARAVKRALAKHDAPSTSVDSAPSFGVLHSDTRDARFTNDVVMSVVFDPQRLRRTLQDVTDKFNLRREQQAEVTSTTLYRYRHHQMRVLEHKFRERFPLKIGAASLRFKWDETQCQVGVQEMKYRGADGSLKTKSRPEVASVMLGQIWIKTDMMPNAMPWCPEPLRISRTTSDCLWFGWTQMAPIGPFSSTGFDYCSQECVEWLWVIWVSDEAKSNLRMINWARQECRRLLPTALVLAVPCVVHICHRTIVPTLQRYGLANDLYRMAHVMSVGSFLAGLQCSDQEIDRHSDSGSPLRGRPSFVGPPSGQADFGSDYRL